MVLAFILTAALALTLAATARTTFRDGRRPKAFRAGYDSRHPDRDP